MHRCVSRAAEWLPALQDGVTVPCHSPRIDAPYEPLRPSAYDGKAWNTGRLRQYTRIVFLNVDPPTTIHAEFTLAMISFLVSMLALAAHLHVTQRIRDAPRVLSAATLAATRVDVAAQLANGPASAFAASPGFAASAFSGGRRRSSLVGDSLLASRGGVGGELL